MIDKIDGEWTAGIERASGKLIGWLSEKLAPVIEEFDRPIRNGIAAARRGMFGKRHKLVGATEIGLVGVLLILVTPQATQLLDRAGCVLLKLPLAGLIGSHSSCANSGLIAIGALFISLFAAPFLYVLARWSLAIVSDIRDSNSTITEVPMQPTRALIMGLSDLPARHGGIETGRAEAQAYADRLADFTAVVSERGTGTGWQQNMRRIAASLDTLEAIYILPSTDSAGQLDDFIVYANTIAGRQLPIRHVLDTHGERFAIRTANDSPSQDYENYDYVYQGMRRAIDQARSDFPDLKNEEICIDVSPGLKIFSIAAAIATLNSNLVFSYVTSQGREIGKVRFYDVSVSFSDRLFAALKAAGG